MRLSRAAVHKGALGWVSRRYVLRIRKLYLQYCGCSKLPVRRQAIIQHWWLCLPDKYQNNIALVPAPYQAG